eukprot:2456694-Rhodomonas_salina.1
MLSVTAAQSDSERAGVCGSMAGGGAASGGRCLAVLCIFSASHLQPSMLYPGIRSRHQLLSILCLRDFSARSSPDLDGNRQQEELARLQSDAAS